MHTNLSIVRARRWPSLEQSAFRSLPRAVPLRTAATLLAAILVVVFQTGFAAFLAPFLSAQPAWIATYYGLWIVAIAVTAAALLLRPTVRRRCLAVLIICVLAVALTLTHALDLIAKNFIVAMMLLACTAVLALAGNTKALLGLSASVTVLNAALCLLDSMFASGLTSTAGRAAGLAINPNVAAASLLLGATATCWALPSRARIYLLVPTAAAVLVTLSRSGLATSLIVLVIVGILAWKRNGWRMQLGGVQRGAVILVVGLVAWIVVAFSINDRFSLATTGTLKDTVRFVGQGTRTLESRPEIAASSSPGSTTADYGSPQGVVSSQADAEQRNVAAAQGLAKIARTEGSLNARLALFENAFHSYWTGPFLGIGLGPAHALSPHNSYLLFAAAFGHLGLFIPLALLALAVFPVRNLGQIAFGIAFALMLVASHDILLVPQLAVPVSVAIAAARGRDIDANWDFAGVGRRIGYVSLAVSVLFVMCLAIVLGTADRHLAFRLGKSDTPIAPIEARAPHVFGAPIPPPKFPALFRVADEPPGSSKSGTLLREDRRTIADQPSAPDQVTSLGRGRFFIWKHRTLVFSTPDNSDPRTNGHLYGFQVPLSTNPFVIPFVAVVLLWGAGVWLYGRRVRRSQ